MQPKNLIHSVINSQHTKELASQLGEVAIDQFLSNELLKEIPVIGTAVSLLKAGNGIAAYFFAKKIILFLNEIEKIPKTEREKFIEKNSSIEDLESLGETTLIILERADSAEIAKMLGRAFCLMVAEEIIRPDFDLYAHIIKGLNPYLIRQMDNFYEYESSSAIEVPAGHFLSSYGLITTSTMPLVNEDRAELKESFNRNNFGQYFYKKIVQNKT